MNNYFDKTFKEYKSILEKIYPQTTEGIERLEHVLRVYEKGLEIIKNYQIDLNLESVKKTLLFHDAAKFFPKEKFLNLKLKKEEKAYLLETDKAWHALLFEKAMKEIYPEIKFNPEELDAIKYHTTGFKKMTLLSKLLFISDFLEDGRKIPSAFNNYSKYSFDELVGMIMYHKISLNTERKLKIHSLTLNAYTVFKKYVKEERMRLCEIFDLLNGTFAHDIRIYEMNSVSPFYDYALVATVFSQRQLIAASEHLRKKFTVKRFERGEEWTLVDLDEIVIHLFTNEARETYSLDRLYRDLPQECLE